MCQLPVNITDSPGEGTSIVSRQGRYKSSFGTFWTSFIFSSTPPFLVPDVSSGLYDLEVTVTNDLGQISLPYITTFEATSNCVIPD